MGSVTDSTHQGEFASGVGNRYYTLRENGSGHTYCRALKRLSQNNANVIAYDSYLYFQL